MQRNSVQGPCSEIWWKAVCLSNLCDFFEKQWYMLWLTGIFFISEGFEDFFWPKAITNSPFNMGFFFKDRYHQKLYEIKLPKYYCHLSVQKRYSDKRKTKCPSSKHSKPWMCDCSIKALRLWRKGLKIWQICSIDLRGKKCPRSGTMDEWQFNFIFWWHISQGCNPYNMPEELRLVDDLRKGR